MEKNWMDPNVEGKEAVLTTVKTMYTKGGTVNESKSDDSLDAETVETIAKMDIDSASALVTIMVLETLEKNEFVKTNVDILTDGGREIGQKLVDEKYPLDAMSTMSVLLELFGEGFSQSDAMMLTDMVLICHDKGIVELNRLAKEFEASEANGSGDASDEEE